MTTTTLLVRKDALAETRLQSADDAALADGQVRVRVDAAALTSNNVTYAAFGDSMNYWQFFPTAQEGWGIIPVWGFGTVVQSLQPGVAVGERLYGYWPLASHAVLQPARLSAGGFVDAASHRRSLHPVYNQYLRVTADPFYTADSEPVQALLRPLFATSWLIDDFLADNDFFGARTLLLSSASSKTAYGTAFQLKQRAGIEIVGLTSPGNRAFCESLGCYHRVLAYDELDRVPADTPCVYVDFAGNAKLRREVHTRFTDLRYSCAIGGTHVEDLAGRELGAVREPLPGPRPTLFFAPDQIKKRHVDWGPAEFGRRLTQAWQAFRDQVGNPAAPWLVVQRHEGAPAVQAAYAQVLGGRGDARTGHILAF
jgi:hypothetical protein